MKPSALLLSALFLTALTGESSLTAEPIVARIDIDTSWGGLGESPTVHLTISRSGETYLLGEQTIEVAAIDRLVGSLHQPPIPQPDRENLGLTQAWLTANAIHGPSTNKGPFTAAAANLQALYRSAFSDVNIIASIVPSLFSYSKTDDYPSTRVAVTLQDGSTIRAISDSYYLLMLPWKVSLDGPPITTFNADISRSIAALLPKTTANRARLSGDDLLPQAQDAVMRHIEKDWNLLDAENQAGPAVERLQDEYRVVAAEINPYHNVEYGKAWKGSGSHEENLHATLRRPGFPTNFTDALVLRYHKGQTEGVEEFLRSASKYENLVLSVPWLKSLMDDQPRIQYRLSYVHDASLGDKAMGVFAEDMRRMGRRALADEVRAVQSEVALLIIGMRYYESYWLVLPDRRLVLWRYRGGTGLLKWTMNDFVGTECSRYQGTTDRCVGRIVSADGTLVKD
jgi:hypothetical protein